MTEKEFAEIIAGLKAVYSDPKYIDGKFAMGTWYELLKDLDYEVASMATKSYMQSEHFPPTPADIRRYASQIQSPLTDDMSELEAWSLVSKAARNGTYGAEEEFAKLPKLIQQTLGSPSRLREMASLEESETETIEQSHFVRNYRAKLELSRKNRILDAGLQMRIAEIRQENTPQIEVKVDESGLIEDKQEKSGGIPDDVEELLKEFHESVSRAV